MLERSLRLWAANELTERSCVDFVLLESSRLAEFLRSGKELWPVQRRDHRRDAVFCLARDEKTLGSRYFNEKQFRNFIVL